VRLPFSSLSHYTIPLFLKKHVLTALSLQSLKTFPQKFRPKRRQKIIVTLRIMTSMKMSDLKKEIGITKKINKQVGRILGAIMNHEFVN
jgi:hypothetical protein